jgi:VanZ family protein
LAVLAWFVLFVATHWPTTPDLGNVGGLDKIVHFAAFAVLAVLCCWAVSCRWRLNLARLSWIVAALTAYAALDELLQIPIPGRTADPLDWFADLAGATCGAIAFVLIAAVGKACRRENPAARPTVDSRALTRS